MQEIVSAVHDVSQKIAQISSTAAEQSDGVHRISAAVEELDRMTQQNAALVEQSAAAAESLKGQAEQLVQAVAVFKLALGGETAVAARRVHPPTRNDIPAERRGPARAKNVARPNFRPKNEAQADVPGQDTEASPRKTGTGDEWTSF